MGGICVCGHTEDEHGSYHRYPGDSDCVVNDCACPGFEEKEEDK